MSDQEPQQNTPNRLRQRLLGALVVVALAVLILPPWMDGGGLKTPAVLPVPPAPVVEQPAQITIPKPSPEQQAALKNPPASFLSAEEPKTSVPTPLSGDAIPSVAPPSQSNNSMPADSADEPTRPSSPPASTIKDHQPSSASVTQPSPAKVPPPAEPKPRTEASADTSAAPKSTKNEEWVVQLGSFSDELNARGLAKSVSDAGFKVDIYPLFAKKGTVWRVRVGPFATREQAVKTTMQLRERLGRDGLVMPK
ncbi:MAG TPA: SPOR domain-containing protein [Halothiobacillus sp.]|nr:SPOR domain-containing protein [Halothiobacillus sp.]